MGERSFPAPLGCRGLPGRGKREDEKVVLRLVEMPLKFRFRTSFGEMTVKRFVLVR